MNATLSLPYLRELVARALNVDADAYDKEVGNLASRFSIGMIDLVVDAVVRVLGTQPYRTLITVVVVPDGQTLDALSDQLRPRLKGMPIVTLSLESPPGERYLGQTRMLVVTEEALDQIHWYVEPYAQACVISVNEAKVGDRVGNLTYDSIKSIRVSLTVD